MRGLVPRTGYLVLARQNIDRTIGKTAKASPVAHDLENTADPDMVTEALYLHRTVEI